MRNCINFFLFAVLGLPGIGCSGSSAGPADSGPSGVRDTLSADGLAIEAPRDARSPGDTAGAGCRSDSTRICATSTAGFVCPLNMEPDTASICPIATFATSPNEALLCCALKPESSTCSRDTSVTCAGSSNGYSCTGSDSPAQSSAIICGAGSTSADKTTFCCREFQSTSCRIDIKVGGCGQQYPFRCTGTQTPSDTDSGLQCSKGTQFANDTIGFCCTVKE